MKKEVFAKELAGLINHLSLESVLMIPRIMC